MVGVLTGYIDASDTLPDGCDIVIHSPMVPIHSPDIYQSPPRPTPLPAFVLLASIARSCEGEKKGYRCEGEQISPPLLLTKCLPFYTPDTNFFVFSDWILLSSHLALPCTLS